MLIETKMQDYCILDKTTHADGYGGTVVEYVDGAPFRAVAVQLQSTEMEIAYQTGQKRLYAIFFKPIVGLEQNMMVKRLEDGLIFRITATPDPNQKPVFSSLDVIRTTMEVVTV